MTRAQELEDVLAAGSELNIICHNNPDPDCLASALALGRIAAEGGIEERNILYSGEISHQQNRTLVNLLGLDLQPFDPAVVEDHPSDSLVAFVDHAKPGANNMVPADTRVDIVVDHHPADDVEARFVDQRPEFGAAATILTDYLHELDVEFDDLLATALLFAIRRETLNFLRGATPAEYEAAGSLHAHADETLLRELSNPSVTGATVDAIATAIENRTTTNATLVSHVGRTNERDAVPQAADYLATLEGVETVIVFGIVNEAIHLSGRSPDPRVHVGTLLSETFDDVGSAGGHHDVAGGEIPLGIFADYTTDEDELVQIVETVVTDRLFDGLALSAESEP